VQSSFQNVDRFPIMAALVRIGLRFEPAAQLRGNVFGPQVHLGKEWLESRTQSNRDLKRLGLENCNM
jgi:hypothetical protein